MRLKTILSLILLDLAFSIGYAAPGAMTPGFEYSFDQSYPENLVINNRILLKINGKPITVMDVVRKMDLLFYRQYPDLASSQVARYQFYTNAWRSLLAATIDDQLIMADAEEKKVEVNDGEVREELEKLFGPDVVLNLDKMGLTLQEAFDLLKTELTVQRMTAIMVRSKAMPEVNPKNIRERYESFLKENPPQDFWVYQILSIRGKGHETVAQELHRMMEEEKIPFEQVVSVFGKQDPQVEFTYSDEFIQKDKDLSLAYKAVLEALSAGSSSAPVFKKDLSRIFCLKEVKKEEGGVFKEKEEELKADLLQEAMSRHNMAYRTKLREHYGLTEEYLNQVIPEDLHPFALK